MTIKKKVLEDYPFRTELHAHTLPVSRCSEFHAEALVEVYKKTGANAIVLTNHLTPDHFVGRTKEEVIALYIGAFCELKECAEREGMVAIFGMELRFGENSNDYLIYGIDEEDVARIVEYVESDLATFREGFWKEGYLLIQAHPKRNGMVDVPLSLLDGYEAFNMHPGHNSRPGLSSRVAHEAGLIVTGGTDFHHPTHEGLCLLRTKKMLTNSHEVAEVLRSGDYVLDIAGSIVLP